MKKIISIFLSLLGVVLLLSSCNGLGTKECSCKEYRDGEYTGEWTQQSGGLPCSSLDMKTTGPHTIESRCTELF